MVWELLVGPFQLSIFSGSVIDRGAPAELHGMLPGEQL